MVVADSIEHHAAVVNQPPRLVLASASPRRRELLSALGASFTVMATDAEESQDPAPAAIVGRLPSIKLPLHQHPTLLAWRKANAVAVQHPEALVLGADTVVVLDGQVLNKPADDTEARLMLRMLAGQTHTVYTGLCLIRPDQRAAILEVVAAEVVFTPQSDEAIAAYVATGEPRDKAGAYGIQGMGGRLVQEVRGSYTAVVGLPLTETYQLLSAAGISGLDDPAATYQRWLRGQGKEPPPWPQTSP